MAWPPTVWHSRTLFVCLLAACTPAVPGLQPVDTDLPTFQVPDDAASNPIEETAPLPGGWQNVERDYVEGEPCPVLIYPIQDGDSIVDTVAHIHPDIAFGLGGWEEEGGPYHAVYVFCAVGGGDWHAFAQSWTREQQTTLDYYRERNSTRPAPGGDGPVGVAIRFARRTDDYAANYLGDFEGNGW